MKNALDSTSDIGKSMMMRHLFFEVAQDYNTYELLPVLVPLKNYTVADTNIAKCIYKIIKDFDKTRTYEEFEEELKLGRCLILLDEISSNARDIFENSMARLYDVTRGAYVRPLHAGMSPEQLAIIFSKFCARTYY